MYWLTLFIAVVANVFANISFKIAMARGTLEQGDISYIKLFIDPWLWVGFASAFLLLGSYLYALQGIQLTLAYPIVTGMAMLGIAVAGSIVFGEQISAARASGMLLIVLGVVVLQQSK